MSEIRSEDIATEFNYETPTEFSRIKNPHGRKNKEYSAVKQFFKKVKKQIDGYSQRMNQFFEEDMKYFQKIQDLVVDWRKEMATDKNEMEMIHDSVAKEIHLRHFKDIQSVIEDQFNRYKGFEMTFKEYGYYGLPSVGMNWG